MKNSWGTFTFFLFAFLLLILALQLSLISSSCRLNDRFGELLSKLENIGSAASAVSQRTVRADDTESYPGDEGDWRIWAFHVEPRTLNPLSVERDIYTTWITQLAIFEPLLEYDFDTLKLKPHLAKSYDISDDGLEITFTLRDDIHFSDGSPITTDDIIFTYESIINPEVDAADLANLFIDVKEVVKVSDRVVKFVMKQVYFKSLENVSFWDVGILPKHIYQFEDAMELNNRVSDPIGSGPYAFESWQVGKEIVLRRNENYWGKKPKLKKVIYRFISNDVARLQALRSHEIDMVRPTEEQFADLTAEEGFQDEFHCLAYWAPQVPFYYMCWNQDTAFFSDRRVRLAMTHIVDREKIVSSLLKGNAKVVTGSFYVNSEQYDKTIQPWPYDIDRAKQLLDEAGWIDTNGDGIRDKDGKKFSFEFTIPSRNIYYSRLGKMLKDSAARVGIEVIIDPVEWSILMVKVNDRKFEAVSMGWGGDVLQDPYQLWHSSQIGNRGANYAGFRNAEADAIIEEARRTLDEDRRTELYHKFHAILHYEQPYTFLYTRPIFRIVDNRFKNTNIYPLGLNYFEWYVPKLQQKYK